MTFRSLHLQDAWPQQAGGPAKAIMTSTEVCWLLGVCSKTLKHCWRAGDFIKSENPQAKSWYYWKRSRVEKWLSR